MNSDNDNHNDKTDDQYDMKKIFDFDNIFNDKNIGVGANIWFQIGGILLLVLLLCVKLKALGVI